MTQEAQKTDLREKAYEAFNDAFSALKDGWLDGAVGRRQKAGVDAVLAIAMEEAAIFIAGFHDATRSEDIARHVRKLAEKP